MTAKLAIAPANRPPCFATPRSSNELSNYSNPTYIILHSPLEAVAKELPN